MKLKHFFAVLGILMLSIGVSCEKQEDSDNGQTWEERWVIGSKTIIGSNRILCFWIKKNDNPVWQMARGYIKGFTYEEGYEYVVDVKATVVPDPPQDAGSITYSLIRIISKEKKDSDVPELTLDISKCIPTISNSILDKAENAEYIGNGIMKLDSLYIYQGDIVLSEEQAMNVATKSGAWSNQTKYWPNNTVYYTFGEDFSAYFQVNLAIQEWESKTSLEFVQGTGNGNYIEFIHDEENSNWSSLGMKGGRQELCISSICLAGEVMHEIGHAVGLIHEQSRNDRDNYVTVHYENIIEEAFVDFNKFDSGTVTDVGTFDFGSLMLYSSNDFSVNGEATMTTKNGLCFTGQRNGLSAGDVQGVAAMYGPPFHKLIADMRVITDEINGIYETYETEIIYTLKIYADKACTTPTSLTYPRNVTIYKDHAFYDDNLGRIRNVMTTTNVTLPAGTSSYAVGYVRNTEQYTMSNAVVYDVTTYSVSPYNNLVGSRIL